MRRRQALVGIVLFLFWATMMALLVRREVLPGLQAEAEASYGTILSHQLEPSRTRMAILLAGRRVGTTDTHVKPRADGTAQIQNETDLVLTVLGNEQKVHLESLCSLDARHVLRGLRIAVDMPLLGRTEVVGDVVGNLLRLRIKTAEGEQVQEYPFDGSGTFSNGLSPFLGMPNLAVGKRWTIRHLHPLQPGGIQTMQASVEARESMEWNGAERDAFRVVIEDGRREYTAWITPAGEVLREEVPLGERGRLVLERLPDEEGN